MNGVLRVARRLGAPVRIYVPFGLAWVPYALEQIRKSPYIVGWVIRDAIWGRFIDQPPLALR
jgi:proline dehydrogenase